MKLKKLIVKNFRQFSGETEIDFASGSNNVTIIFGANGAGKTGIFRAMVFCLYGEKKLEQDTKNSEIHLVNWDLLNSVPAGKAEVSLQFEHDNNEFIISREVVESRRSNRIVTLKDNAKLTIFDKETGEEHVITENNEEVNELISEILPKNVKNLFLFDAERLELLSQLESKGNTTNKIQTGVYDLLQLNSLAKGKDILNTSYTEQNADLAKSAGNIHMDGLKHTLEEKNVALKDSELRANSAQDNLERAQEKLDSLEAEIAENKDLQDLNKERKKYKEMLAQVNNFRDSVFQNSKMSIVDFAEGLLSDSFIDVDVKLRDMQSRNTDIFSKQVLKQTLENGVCMLCGNDLSQHSGEEHVKKLLTQFEDSAVTPVLTMISRSIDTVKENSERYSEQLKRDYDDLYDQEEKSVNYEQRITEIEMKLSGSEDLVKNLDEKSENTINTLKKDLFKFEKQCDDEQLNQTSLIKEIDELKDEINDIDFQNQKLNQMKLAMQKTKEITDQLDDVMKKYATKSRHHLEEQVKQMYNSLIEQNDKNTINTLTIDENFELAIQRDDGSNLIGDFSSGQRQVLSLSFITALASLASKGRENEVSFPLFMDTPFARLDVENTGSLISTIPNLTGQWIILVTNSELGEKEISEFMESKKAGKIYKISKEGKNLSKIEPYSLELLLQESRESNG